MSNSFRFTPASMEAFKRTAKDIKRAYGLPLQKAQELLACTYGYPDFHALQEHLKLSPTPGPFPQDMPMGEAMLFRINATAKWVSVAGSIAPVGRIEIEDIGIVEAPDSRKLGMNYQSYIEDFIAAKTPPELSSPVTDYVTFEVSNPAEDWFVYGTNRREGVFRLTGKGYALKKGMDWLLSELQAAIEDDDPAAQAVLRDRIEYAIATFPHHPYFPVNFAEFELDASANDDDDETIPVDLAKRLLQRIKNSRSMFESIMPKRFSGTMEPTLTGNHAYNEAYFSALYLGAILADSLGQTRTALAWARRSLRFDKRDGNGLRFLVAKLTN